jgi:hypothetical protein
MEARAAMEATFGVTGAPAIVSAVLKGVRPRTGRCLNGLEYFVHGIGYTVVFPSGGQAHIDGGPTGDIFSVYDLSFFLETLDDDPVPSSEALTVELDALVSAGELSQVAVGKFAVPREGEPTS